MPDSFDLNNQSRAADAAPAIPTSASEVSVRTMASDLELMGRSGGMVGQSAPQGMQVPVTLHAEATAAAAAPAGVAAPAASAASQMPQAPSGRGKHILITVVIILAAVGLFALGYFVL